MKKIGILCATAKELSPFLTTIQNKKAKEYAMHSFYIGKIADVEVVVVYSGCGKINASITTQLLIERYEVDAIIFSGIAGGIKEEIEVFDTVVCTASTFHDTDNGIYMDFPVMDEPIFYADDYLVSLARKAAGGIKRKIYFGIATTGDRYAEPIHPDALCIDMETASAAHTCYMNQVPFVAIRSISDNNKEAGQEAINRNYEKAAYQSYQFVYTMLQELGKDTDYLSDSFR
ncbi:MAG: 5'-methylthioadenosine/S-adenosylhomocysteine nucleosidase [Lachnospiraceae bacterium]|nr:5'-methylthioadenosine/S-adenosylhomocysteine nucleosidase [Lachnospiraceae bacterium]